MFDADPKVILLVEDNADDEKLTLRALRQSDVQTIVHVARDGREAIDFLLNIDNPLPNLVLLDLKLPKMNGLEVLETLRQDARTNLQTVVIMTSSDEESDIQNAYRLGANSYIRKPVEFDEFMDAIRQLVNYWLRLNQSNHPWPMFAQV